MDLKTPSELRRELTQKPSTTQPRLPPFTRIEVDETIRGVRYAGSFTFKVPTLADQIVIGQMKARYLPNGSKTDPTSELLVEQICYLEVTLQEPRPSWWRPLEFTEADVLAKVYVEAMGYANTFLGRDKIDRATDSADGVGDDGGDDGGAESAVVKDLPSADERPTTIIAHSTRAK
jgi:hypothetical protein